MYSSHSKHSRIAFPTMDDATLVFGKKNLLLLTTFWKYNTEYNNTEWEWESRDSHRVFGRRQHLFNHHAVSSEGASVQSVGPVWTEGAQTGVCKKFTYVHTHKQIHTNIKQKTQTETNKHKHKTKTQKLQHATSRENKSKPPSEKKGEKGMSDGQRGGSKKKIDMGRPCRR